jgi:hypothetical protein
MTTVQKVRQWAREAEPVFICGLERSGTSMLLVSLSRHPALFPVRDVYETFVFLKPRSMLQAAPPPMMAAYLKGKENAAKLRRFCADLKGELPELPGGDLVRAFFYFCAHEVYPGTRPLEKTPGHVRKIDRVLELFPKARVIVCTRDPVSIVASYRKRLAKEKSLGHGPESWGWLDRTPEQLIAHFEAVTAKVLEARARWPGQVFVAPYDWLTNTPEEALRALCEFARVPFSQDVLAPRPVPGRKVDLLLSQPITRQESTDHEFVDEATGAMIRARTVGLKALWETPGLGSDDGAVAATPADAGPAQ